MDHKHTTGGWSGRKLALCMLPVIVLLLAVIGFFMAHGSVDVMSPVGTVGRQERSLIILALLLALIVVVPVFTMTFMIAWRYRATNTRARYHPDWDHSPIAETIWWLIPILLISFLATVAWRSSHSLDPYRPLASSKKPITIQVIALDWRWLFLYPAQGTASINYVEFPAGTPVHFEITSDAPMNSFWIPKLGGQIYAMSGMSTSLHLVADTPGSYRGMSANISGDGFADMTFQAKATSDTEFSAWVNQARQAPPLTSSVYSSLTKPNTDHQEQTYSLPDTSLYASVMEKYMNSKPAMPKPMNMEAMK